MRTSDTISKPTRTPEEMLERVKLAEGETMEDMLSLYDAMDRYGVSRTALRDAVLTKKLSGLWIGGINKKSLYMRREDIIQYITLPQSSTRGRRPVPWRTQDAKESRNA
jgi:hypothetical protein